MEKDKVTNIELEHVLGHGMEELIESMSMSTVVSMCKHSSIRIT
jgi:hypothetical protein